MLLTKKDLILYSLNQKRKTNIYCIYYVLKELFLFSNSILFSFKLPAVLLKSICWHLKYKLIIKTFHLNILNNFILQFMERLNTQFNSNQVQVRYLQQKQQKLTVLRSPFVYKTTREQFTKIQYSAIIQFNLTNSNLVYFEYVMQNLILKMDKSWAFKLKFIETQIKY